jgi:hypothetical protein
MTDPIASQNIDLPSCITLYIKESWKKINLNCTEVQTYRRREARMNQEILETL